MLRFLQANSESVKKILGNVGQGILYAIASFMGWNLINGRPALHGIGPIFDDPASESTSPTAPTTAPTTTTETSSSRPVIHPNPSAIDELNKQIFGDALLEEIVKKLKDPEYVKNFIERHNSLYGTHFNALKFDILPDKRIRIELINTNTAQSAVVTEKPTEGFLTRLKNFVFGEDTTRVTAPSVLSPNSEIELPDGSSLLLRNLFSSFKRNWASTPRAALPSSPPSTVDPSLLEKIAKKVMGDAGTPSSLFSSFSVYAQQKGIPPEMLDAAFTSFCVNYAREFGFWPNAASSATKSSWFKRLFDEQRALPSGNEGGLPTKFGSTTNFEGTTPAFLRRLPEGATSTDFFEAVDGTTPRFFEGPDGRIYENTGPEGTTRIVEEVSTGNLAREPVSLSVFSLIFSPGSFLAKWKEAPGGERLKVIFDALHYLFMAYQVGSFLYDKLSPSRRKARAEAREQTAFRQEMINTQADQIDKFCKQLMSRENQSLNNVRMLFSWLVYEVIKSLRTVGGKENIFGIATDPAQTKTAIDMKIAVRVALLQVKTLKREFINATLLQNGEIILSEAEYAKIVKDAGLLLKEIIRSSIESNPFSTRGRIGILHNVLDPELREDSESDTEIVIPREFDRKKEFGKIYRQLREEGRKARAAKRERELVSVDSFPAASTIVVPEPPTTRPRIEEVEEEAAPPAAEETRPVIRAPNPSFFPVVRARAADDLERVDASVRSVLDQVNEARIQGELTPELTNDITRVIGDLQRKIERGEGDTALSSFHDDTVSFFRRFGSGLGLLFDSVCESLKSFFSRKSTKVLLGFGVLLTLAYIVDRKNGGNLAGVVKRLWRNLNPAEMGVTDPNTISTLADSVLETTDTPSGSFTVNTISFA